jgi:tetratricopeptide (TPR) repeat protein
MTAGDTRNSAAYEAYLLGRFQWNKRTTAGMIRAADYFNRAIAADSTYARAWSGLADTYVLFVPNEYDVPGINQDSILTLAEAAARRALALVPALGEAHSSLGEILEYRSRWTEATEAFQQGVALSPGYATGHQWYSYNLMAMNQWDAAIREAERAKQLDPLSPVIIFTLATAYDGANRFSEATPLFADGFALSPEVPYALWFFFTHELGAHGIEAAAHAYRRTLVATTADRARAERIERELINPATRQSAIDEIARTGRPEHGVALHRWLRGDEATIAFVASLAGTPRARAVVPFAVNAALGPALRANPKMQAALMKLDYPSLTSGALERPRPEPSGQN